MTEPAQRAPAIVAEALTAGLRRRLLCVRRFQTGQFGEKKRAAGERRGLESLCHRRLQPHPTSRHCFNRRQDFFDEGVQGAWSMQATR